MTAVVTESTQMNVILVLFEKALLERIDDLSRLVLFNHQDILDQFITQDEERQWDEIKEISFSKFQITPKMTTRVIAKKFEAFIRSQSFFKFIEAQTIQMSLGSPQYFAKSDPYNTPNNILFSLSESQRCLLLEVFQVIYTLGKALESHKKDHLEHPTGLAKLFIKGFIPTGHDFKTFCYQGKKDEFERGLANLILATVLK